MPHAETYDGYIDYMSRSEAVRNEKFHRFNAFRDSDGKNVIDGADETMFDRYTDYLSNPLKTGSLFNRIHDRLPIENIQYTKKYFKEGQKNGSPLWQLVFSFRNEWLEKNGLLNPDTNEIHEEKIYDATREAMKVLIQKEGLECEWVGSVHFNTQHLHVHIAMVEKKPTREWINYQDKTSPENSGWQYKGKFKIRHVNAAKSKFVNHLLAMQDELSLVLHEMNHFIREGKKNLPALLETIFYEKFDSLKQKLPKNRSRWKYGYAAGLEFKNELDQLITLYLNGYMKEELQQLISTLRPISQAYEEAYGNPKNKPNYLENKIYGKDGLYASIGNIILKQLRELDKAESKSKPRGKLSLKDVQDLQVEQRCITISLPPADKVFSSDSDDGYAYYLEKLSQEAPPTEQTNFSLEDFSFNDDFEKLPSKNLRLSDVKSLLNDRLEELSKNQLPIEHRIAAYENYIKQARADKVKKMNGNSPQKSEGKVDNKMNDSEKNLAKRIDSVESSSQRKLGSKMFVDYESGASNISGFSKINQEGILEQAPQATFIFGINQWRLTGREIKPAEKNNPILILAPVFSEESGAREILHFIPIPMYDVSQTQESKINFFYANQEGTIIRKNHFRGSSQVYGQIKNFDLEKLERQVRNAMKQMEYDRQHMLNMQAHRENNREINFE